MSLPLRSYDSEDYVPSVLEPKVSVVIPTLNEAKNLPFVLPEIPAWVHEVIIVDGRSTDNTVEVAKSLLDNVRIVLEERKGKGAALSAGFNAAEGDIIVMLDADGSMAPQEIGGYVRMLRDGADFVKGSRFLQGAGTTDMEFYRRWGNTGFTVMVNLLFNAKYNDLCYGYSAFWKRTLPYLALDATGFEVETMMNIRALKAGLKVYEAPSFEAPRIHGTSNLRTIPDGFRVLRTIFQEWFKGKSYIPSSILLQNS
ncbi:MAG: glycosyltransferase family 2 protein [Trueperaceae bacterium]|nr:glycosyltransferase family 2 protein [Trueperaceae bacterium]